MEDSSSSSFSSSSSSSSSFSLSSLSPLLSNCNLNIVESSNKGRMVVYTGSVPLNPGAVIFKSAPFSFAIQRHLAASKCSSCLSRKEKLLICRGCQSVSYCNRECQKIDWEFHKGKSPIATHLMHVLTHPR